MLTVKHIEESGHESICQATGVSFNPDSERMLVATGVGAASVSADDCNRYTSGKVYVMNESGKTVGNYVL